MVTTHLSKETILKPEQLRDGAVCFEASVCVGMTEKVRRLVSGCTSPSRLWQAAILKPRNQLMERGVVGREPATICSRYVVVIKADPPFSSRITTACTPARVARTTAFQPA